MGKYHVYHLLKANSTYTDKKDAKRHVGISATLKKELYWWYTMVSLSYKKLRYPDPDSTLPAWALVGYTDAAGGTALAMGAGCGAVLQEEWVYIPWSEAINGAAVTEKGTRIGRKLSALELIGPLALIVAAPDKVRGKPIRIMVDNMGSVIIWQKGYSTSCELSSTLVIAIYEVSIALECTVVLEKIARCSDSDSSMEDA